VQRGTFIRLGKLQYRFHNSAVSYDYLLKEPDHLEDFGADGRIILKWTLNTMGEWTG
jgi:hypothetical protein